MQGWGGLQYLYFLEFLSISDVWDVGFLDYIVLESKGFFSLNLPMNSISGIMVHFKGIILHFRETAHLPLP